MCLISARQINIEVAEGKSSASVYECVIVFVDQCKELLLCSISDRMCYQRGNTEMSSHSQDCK